MFASLGFPSRPAFNEPPFDLGSYDTIATYKGGKYGRAKHFAIGYSAEGSATPETSEVLATYTSFLGQPSLAKLSIKQDGLALTITFDGNHVTGRFTSAQSGSGEALDIAIDHRLPEAFLATLFSLDYFVYTLIAEKQKQAREIGNVILEFARKIPKLQTIAVAPVRTKPKRTYDPVGDEFRPEGDHIPMILARALARGTPGKRDSLKEALNKFGESSGLFTEIKVKALGKSPSDPFQILVAVAGRPFNVSDIGYGVSQSLPVVIESTLGGASRLLLLQQPEVHLHPRAQAALGSFFTGLVVNQQKRFVIETHSDYLIDRVRQDIAGGVIAPDQVALVFFERKHAQSRVYPLSLDKHGNISGAPPSYRDFFLREEEGLLRRAHHQ